MAESDDRVEQRSWFWAFNALRTPKPGQAPSCARCRILIAETVLFNEGEAIAWLFTTRDGEVKTKHTKRLKVETIAESLLLKARADANAAGARPAQRYAVAVRRGNDSAKHAASCG